MSSLLRFNADLETKSSVHNILAVVVLICDIWIALNSWKNSNIWITYIDIVNRVKSIVEACKSASQVVQKGFRQYQTVFSNDEIKVVLLTPKKYINKTILVIIKETGISHNFNRISELSGNEGFNTTISPSASWNAFTFRS